MALSIEERQQIESMGLDPDAINEVIAQFLEPQKVLVDKFLAASKTGDWSTITKDDVFAFMEMLTREQQQKMVRWALQHKL